MSNTIQHLEYKEMINEPTVAAAEREPKANILMSEIYRMEKVVDRLCYLRDRVQNGNVPRVNDGREKVDTVSPTVSGVFSDGPEILQIQFNKMNDLIEQIEQELF